LATSVTPESIGTQHGGTAVRGWLTLRRLLTGADASRGLLALLDQAVVSCLSFGTSAMVASACGRAGLGIFHLVLTLLYLVMNVQGELLNAPYTVYRGTKRGRALHAYAGSLLVHQLLLTLVSMGGLTVFLLSLVWYGEPAELAPSLVALLLALPSCLLHCFLRHFAFAAFQFRVALMLDLVAAALQLAALALLSQRDWMSVPLVLVTMGVASGAACLGWALARPEPIRFASSRLWPDWRENWSFGRWALASHAVGCAGTYVLPWMLAMVHDESATGTLAGAGKLSALAATFVLGIAHYLTPRAVEAFARGGTVALKQVLFATSAIFVAGVGAFCGIVWVSGETLIVLLFGHEFAGTGSLATVLSLVVLLNSLAVVGGNGLWAIRKPQANLISDAAALLTTIPLAGLLVTSQGAMGVAVAMLVGGTVGAVVRGITLAVLLPRVSHP